MSVSQEVLIEDLLSINLTTPTVVSTSTQPSSVDDLLTPELDSLFKISDLQIKSTSSTDVNDLLLSTDLPTPAVVPTSVQPPFVDINASGLNPFMTTSDLPTASSEDLCSLFLSTDLTAPADVPFSVPSVDTSEEDLLFKQFDLQYQTLNTELFGNLFEFDSVPYSPPKQLWLVCENGRGLEIMGTFFRKYVLRNITILII